jgi:hypothetical protein
MRLANVRETPDMIRRVRVLGGEGYVIVNP